MKLVNDGYFVVSNTGIITNSKTKYVIGSKQKGTDYIGVRHKSGGKMFSIQAHRLVWIAFQGLIIDPELEINHKDLNKRNNALSNLELISAQANAQHVCDLITHSSGENKINSKFSNAEVIQYRELYRTNQVDVPDISLKHQVSKTTVWYMLKGVTYKQA